jgi:hypothetical protein
MPALAGRVPTRFGHTLVKVGCSCGLTGVIIKQSLPESRRLGAIPQSNRLQVLQQAVETSGTWLLDPCMRLTEFGKAIGKGQGQEAGPTF